MGRMGLEVWGGGWWGGVWGCRECVWGEWSMTHPTEKLYRISEKRNFSTRQLDRSSSRLREQKSQST